MSLISDTLSWLRGNQFIFYLIHLCWIQSGEASNTNYIVFGLTRPELELANDLTRGESATHYTTCAVKA